MRKKISVLMALSVILPFLPWACSKGKEESLSQTTPPLSQAVVHGASYHAVTLKDGGTIVGVVEFKGKVPAPKEVEVTKDKEVCGKSRKDLSLIISQSGAVQNAVAYIKDIKSGKKMEPTEVTLDQKGCEYHPHALAFPVGSTVKVLNSDGILHNIHSFSKVNSPFNIAQPKFKKTLSLQIDKPEIINVKCDVHAWMDGWLFAADNPYYSVTDQHGKFELTNVPPGTYTVEVWQETLGQASQKVTVKPKEEVKVTFELSKKPPGVS